MGGNETECIIWMNYMSWCYQGTRISVYVKEFGFSMNNCILTFNSKNSRKRILFVYQGSCGILL